MVNHMNTEVYLSESIHKRVTLGMAFYPSLFCIDDLFISHMNDPLE